MAVATFFRLPSVASTIIDADSRENFGYCRSVKSIDESPNTLLIKCIATPVSASLIALACLKSWILSHSQMVSFGAPQSRFDLVAGVCQHYINGLVRISYRIS